MKKYTIFIMALFLFTGTTNMRAATLQVDINGKLTGATEVDVGGALYDVSFVEGSCIDLFGGCPINNGVDFPFTIFGDIAVASQALLDQVFINTPAFDFDSNPALTFGCTDPTTCFVNIPFGATDGDNVTIGTAANAAAEASDHIVEFNVFPVAVDTTDTAAIVYADFARSKSSVPEPGTVVLLLTGMIAMGRDRHRKHKLQPTAL